MVMEKSKKHLFQLRDAHVSSFKCFCFCRSDDKLSNLVRHKRTFGRWHFSCSTSWTVHSDTEHDNCFDDASTNFCGRRLIHFFIVKSLTRESKSNSRFFLSVFAASWLSLVLGALACGLQIGFSPLFSEAGGVIVTVPAMLFWHILIGFGEAAITATLLTQLKRMPSTLLSSFATLGGRLE
jgi:hypothetical protein